ncbi:MAG: hypothetical protein Q8K60_02350 [Parachlamydiaceae bacterium]|nr:hypothetical protein [Parachlamydiaceae bacterium]
MKFLKTATIIGSLCSVFCSVSDAVIGSSRPGVTPASHRTVRETLASYGSSLLTNHCRVTEQGRHSLLCSLKIIPSLHPAVLHK